MEDWRSSKTKEIKLPTIKVRENWRNTMVEDEGPKLEQSKQEILSLVNQKIKELKPQLRNEVKQLVQRDIKPAKDGQDANQWHTSLDLGNDGDFAFIEGDFYQHREGEWKFLFSAKPKKNVFAVGGVSEQYVSQFVNEAIADIEVSSSGEVIRTTTADYTITNETHLSCTVTAQRTVTLPATNTKTVTVKNSVNSSADIIVSGSATFDGQSDWTIKPGNAFKFVPISSGVYDVV
jgi:hypothetical protein